MLTLPTPTAAHTTRYTPWNHASRPYQAIVTPEALAAIGRVRRLEAQNRFRWDRKPLDSRGEPGLERSLERKGRRRVSYPRRRQKTSDLALNGPGSRWQGASRGMVPGCQACQLSTHSVGVGRC